VYLICILFVFPPFLRLATITSNYCLSLVNLLSRYDGSSSSLCCFLSVTQHNLIEYNDSNGFKRKLELGLGISSIIVSVIQAAMLLGVYITPDQLDKGKFVHAYYASFFTLGIVIIFLLLRYYRRLLVALMDHVAREQTLRVTRTERLQLKTSESLAKLKRLIITIFITMVIMCVMSVLSIAMPVAANYLVPMYATNGAASINGFLREVGQLTDEVNKESSLTGSTAMGTAVTLVKSASFTSGETSSSTSSPRSTEIP